MRAVKSYKQLDWRFLGHGDERVEERSSGAGARVVEGHARERAGRGFWILSIRKGEIV